ncbi:MAG: hypothetical protein V3U02_04385 [Calditrichia bacterium]
MAADNRKPLEERKGGVHYDLIQAKARRKKIYQSKIDYFKKTHGGKTPWAVKYEQQKQLKNKLPINI